MPQQFLYGADVGPRLQQVRGKGMAQGVDGHVFGQPGLGCRLLDGTLQTLLKKVMTALHT